MSDNISISACPKQELTRSLYLACACVQSRPFGVALLVAGWERGSGPVLYHTDPSGMFVEYDAKAIGSGSEGAQTVRSCLH